MELKEHIDEIKTALRAGRFLNEASVSQGVVMRILQALGWPVYDSQVVCPEYSVEDKRVDYALCHPKEKPAVFVEVKRVGKGEGADRQLFEYAFHEGGVPMAVLTDGQEWHFYLPGERGRYDERRVYKLDLLERKMDECAERLTRYLSYKQTCSGEALDNARKDYRKAVRERDVKSALPDAWQKLIEEQDGSLIDLIADKVESMCGYKPDVDLVADFLTKQSQSPVEQSVRVVRPRLLEVDCKPKKRKVSSQNGAIGFVLKGREYKARSGREVLTQVLKELAAQDRNFLERFAARPKHGRNRRYVAHFKEELYPGRLDLCLTHSHKLESGWWVGTNYSKQGIKRILAMACEVAGLCFGKDLVLNL